MPSQTFASNRSRKNCRISSNSSWRQSCKRLSFFPIGVFLFEEFNDWGIDAIDLCSFMHYDSNVLVDSRCSPDRIR